MFCDAQVNYRNFTFDKAVAIVKAHESLMISRQPEYENVDSELMEVDKINKEKMINNCKFCGKTHRYGKCPAFGRKCSKCLKNNHFAVVCKTKHVKEIDIEEKNDNLKPEKSCDNLTEETE